MKKIIAMIIASLMVISGCNVGVLYAIENSDANQGEVNEDASHNQNEKVKDEIEESQDASEESQDATEESVDVKADVSSSDADNDVFVKAGASSAKEIIKINSNWEKDGESVNLPDSWEYVHPTMSYIPQMNQKKVTYTKKLNVSAYRGKNIFVKFYAVNKNASVYVDNQLVGNHVGGFSAFTFDITDFVKNDEITLKVVNQNIDLVTMPINTDFTHWAGIYRDVELIVTDDVYISQEDYGSNGVYVNQEVNGSNGELSIKTKVSSKSQEDTSNELGVKVKDKNGKVVASASQAINLKSQEKNQEENIKITVPNVHKWNGVKDPYLYTVDISLKSEKGNVIDSVTNSIGFRKFNVKNGTFYLNGEEYELHGVGMHQDREGYGNALTDEMREEDFKNMQEMGVNAVRTAHYPHDKKTYELADKYGFVVWNEIPFYMIMSKTNEFKNAAKQELIEMIRQSYNHPSIICWGIQNEVNTNEQYKNYGDDFNVDTATLSSFIKELAALAKSEDQTGRFVVQALIDGSKKLDETKTWTTGNKNIDYSAFNFYKGFKSSISSAGDAGREKIKAQYNQSLDNYKKTLGVNSLMISEYGAGGNMSQQKYITDNFSWTDASTEEQHPEQYQSYVHEAAYDAISSRNDVWCAFVWNMFDFSCYRNEGGTTRLNNKGMMEYDHKTKKDVFYFYKANWNKKDKFVHITSSRLKNWQKKYDVKVYSNCDKLELFVNGQSAGYGTKQQNGVFVWKNSLVNCEGETSLKVVANNSKSDAININVVEDQVTYTSHVQDYGWESTSKADGDISGTVQQGKRLEAIKMSLSEKLSGSIEYSTHVQDIGWQKYVSDNELAGTTGQGKRIEALKVRLTGQVAKDYDVYYRVHVEDIGWMGWTKNDQPAGTVGKSKRVEALQVVLVEKDGTAPGSTKGAFEQTYLNYQTHIQDIGWQDTKSDGQMAGTSGQSKRLEGIKISLSNQMHSGTIQYQTHIQDIGWQGWRSNGQMAGTSGQSKRLEAIQIKLTGVMADKYDIYYRVHAQDYGWLGWTKNGASAGTEGLSKRLEAIEIVIVNKGDKAPGSIQNSFYKS